MLRSEGPRGRVLFSQKARHALNVHQEEATSSSPVGKGKGAICIKPPVERGEKPLMPLRGPIATEGLG